MSAVLGGGGEAIHVEEAIKQLARDVGAVDRQRASVDRSNEAAVDVTFHVPGTLVRPDYEGVRTGRWVAAKQLLVVQVATPDAVCAEPGSVHGFLNDSLRAAVELAADHLGRRRPTVSTAEATAVVEAALAARS